MYQSKMTMLPDQENKAVKTLKEFYFFRDIDKQDNLYCITRYDINLLSNGKYELVKTYISFLYNFKAGLKERYINYNYHNHIKYEDVQEIVIFDSLEKAYQKIKMDQFTTDLTVHEDIEIILNLRLAFTYKLYGAIDTVKNNDFIRFKILNNFEMLYKNDLLHYLKMKFNNINFKIENNTLYYN